MHFINNFFLILKLQIKETNNIFILFILIFYFSVGATNQGQMKSSAIRQL